MISYTHYSAHDAWCMMHAWSRHCQLATVESISDFVTDDNGKKRPSYHECSHMMHDGRPKNYINGGMSKIIQQPSQVFPPTRRLLNTLYHHTPSRNMFSKITLLIATMVAFVAATPVPGATGGQCNTGSMQCCQQVHQSQTDSHSFLAALVGANVQDVTAAIGTNCDPLSVVGLGSGAQWYGICLNLLGFVVDIFSYSTQQPVCCTGNSFSMFLYSNPHPVWWVAYLTADSQVASSLWVALLLVSTCRLLFRSTDEWTFAEFFCLVFELQNANLSLLVRVWFSTVPLSKYNDRDEWVLLWSVGMWAWGPTVLFRNVVFGSCREMVRWKFLLLWSCMSVLDIIVWY